MRTTLALVALVICSSPKASAQNTTSPASADAAAASRPFKDATATSVARLPDAALRLTASKGEKTVEGNIGFALGQFVFDTKLSGVLDEGNPDTNLVTLDSISTGSTAEFGASYLFWRPSADVQQQKNVCVEYLRSQAATLDDARKIGQSGTSDGCTWSSLPKESFREQFEAATSDTRRDEVCKQYAFSILVDPKTVPCVSVNLPETAFYDRFAATTKWGLPVQVGSRYKIGRDKLKWADATTGDMSSNVEEPWELSFGVNIMLPAGFAMSGEYRHQHSFSEQPKRSICGPLAGTTTTTCQDVAFGLYDSVRREVVTVTIRKWLGAFAADFRYSYDFNNGGVHTVELPLYFLSTEGKGLSGGIAAGWTSDVTKGEKGWSVRAFVGEVLNIWPGSQ
jgi:hypothetical protein